MRFLQDKTVSLIFVIGSDPDSILAKEELEKYNDILQVDVPESYSNLVYKVLLIYSASQILAAYLWIAANYPTKFVLKVDLDVVILLDKVSVFYTTYVVCISDPSLHLRFLKHLEFSLKLFQLVSHLEEPCERSIRCYVLQKVQPVREVTSPWYIPISSYPEQYLPDYCNGPTYLMTPAALAALIEAVGMAKVFEVEDAFFTGVLARLSDVRIQNERGIWNRRVSFIRLT
ncbi:hypothetical protein GCK32_012631 [Trichostrongylus colubriformis]|uniref:Hexosyltransferase n=1 Tax=Trichostrongylus colubriformis TaxID=6319 RepID=A0AAN8IHP6_TRICO